MSSRLWISGESPPCTQRNCWFMRAASGRQSNASMQASYTLSEYFILPGSRETTRQQRTLHVSRVLETTNSIRARLSQRAFFPPPFSFFLSFFFTNAFSPFYSLDAFCARRATVNRGGKRKGKGWVGGWSLPFEIDWLSFEILLWMESLRKCLCNVFHMPASFFFIIFIIVEFLSLFFFR